MPKLPNVVLNDVSRISNRSTHVPCLRQSYGGWKQAKLKLLMPVRGDVNISLCHAPQRFAVDLLLHPTPDCGKGLDLVSLSNFGRHSTPSGNGN